jgi:low temperature requirement protein LtrA
VKATGWAALIVLVGTGAFLASQVFAAPTDLASPRNLPSLVYDLSYMALIAMFLIAPALLVQQYQDRKPLQTAGLAFGLWAIVLLGLIILGIIASAAQEDEVTIVSRPAHTGEYVVLCFAATGFFLFFDHAAVGGRRSAAGGGGSGGARRESMRGRRRRRWA